MEESEKIHVSRAKKARSVEEVLEEVEILIDVHFFNLFSETKSSQFLKRIVAKNTNDLNLFKRTWRTLNCTPKTMKVIMEIQENLLCVGKKMEMITRQKKTKSAGATRLACLSTRNTS